MNTRQWNGSSMLLVLIAICVSVARMVLVYAILSVHAAPSGSVL